MTGTANLLSWEHAASSTGAKKAHQLMAILLVLASMCRIAIILASSQTLEYVASNYLSLFLELSWMRPLMPQWQASLWNSIKVAPMWTSPLQMVLDAIM
jgi:hypothetical protein